MISSHVAERQDRIGGHVAIAVVRYQPHWTISQSVRQRWNPWQCVLHDDEPGGPKFFIAFGGKAGALSAMDAILGPKI